MKTPELELLNPEQVDFLEAHQEVLDALLEITEQAGFKAVFGEMLLGEMVSRYLNTLNYDGNDAWEHDIGERFRQYQLQKDEPDFIIDDDDDFTKLEAKYRK